MVPCEFNWISRFGATRSSDQVRVCWELDSISVWDLLLQVWPMWSCWSISASSRVRAGGAERMAGRSWGHFYFLHETQRAYLNLNMFLWWRNHLWVRPDRLNTLYYFWIKWWMILLETLTRELVFFQTIWLSFSIPSNHTPSSHLHQFYPPLPPLPPISCVPFALRLCCAACGPALLSTLMEPVIVQNCQLLSPSRSSVCTLRRARLLGATCERTDKYLCIWLSPEMTKWQNKTKT